MVKHLKIYKTLPGLAALLLVVLFTLTAGCARQAESTSPINILRSSPLWSASGTELLLAASSSGLDRTELLCIDTTTKHRTVVAQAEGNTSALSAWAWNSQPGMVCWVSLDVKGGRKLHCASIDGRMHNQIDLPLRSTIGLECTGDLVVVIDQDELPEESTALPSSTARVYTESLRKQREIPIPFAVYNVQISPTSPDSIIAIADSGKEQTVFNVNVGSGQMERLGTVDGIEQGGGRWKYSAEHRLYFIAGVERGLSPGEMYVWDAGTGESRTVLPGSPLEGDISRFDVVRDKAVVVSGKQLYLIHLNEERVERLTEDEHDYGVPQLSPDADQVAAIRDTRELVVIDLATGNIRVLLETTSR